MSIKNEFSADKVNRKVETALAVLMDSASKEMESYAKSNAPWTDRTSLARDTLKGYSAVKNHEIVAGISGNMSYSKYLELANEKRFAILVPTVNEYSSTVLKGAKKILGG